MKEAHAIAEVRAWRRAAGGEVGLVPTMGYLHHGHLALVARAREENARVVASIFVNPAQFDRAADLEGYPRDLDRDRAVLADAGCDLLFVPDPATIYPPGFQTWVEPGAVAAGKEGGHRPGHFRGVATVVLKLLNIVRPTRAYFGRKDAQQLAVIRTLVRDLDVSTTIVAVPTVREADGLAMSSRNVRLDAAERRAATVLYRALCAGRDAWARGERAAAALRSAMRTVLDTEPRAATDYVSVADPDTFAELERIAGPALLSLAATVGGARLIDNVLLEPRDGQPTGADAVP